MSTHAVEVVEVGPIEAHPDPEVERLEVTRIGGWQCCVQKGEFAEGDLAVYVPPDYLVPTSHPSFKFLERKDGKPMERIRVRRLRGALSQGLLIPVPLRLAKCLGKGADVMEAMGIERYEPPLPKSTGGDNVSGPSGLYCPKFDVENWQRWPDVFKDGEDVRVTEKLHGASARYVYAKTKEGEWTQFCGSRTGWKAEDEKNLWWMAFRQCPAIGGWCEAHPEEILYGEVYGQVQNLKYGAGPNDVFFATFAILIGDVWLAFDAARGSTSLYGVPWVPLVYRGPFDLDMVLRMAEEYSLVEGAKHVREGVVVLPALERTDPELGRVQLKFVSNRYLEKGR